MTKRALTIGTVALAVLLTVIIGQASPVSAHPLGNFTINHYAGLHLSGRMIRVDYVVDLAELPTVTERPALSSGGQEYAAATCGRIAGEVDLGVDGRALPLVAVRSSAALFAGEAGLSTMRIECGFDAAVQLARGEHRVALAPLLDGCRIEDEKDTLSAVFHRWHPRRINANRGPLDIQLKLTLRVWPSGLESSEADLGDHLAQPMHEHHAFDGFHPLGIPSSARQSACKKITLRRVAAEFIPHVGERLKFDLLDRTQRSIAPATNTPHRCKNRRIVETLQLHRGRRFLANLREFLRRFDIGEKVIPERADHFIQRAARIGNRDHRHELRKVGVAGAADQQAIVFTARLLGACAQPRTGTIAVT